MKTENIKKAKFSDDCWKKVKTETYECMHPNCEKPAIDSHIMQKNGILSLISDDRHLWEFMVDDFKKERFVFKRKGIGKIYTFKGFCNKNKHDTSIFKKIETQGNINFDDYESCLLFALRTLYNEIWLKEVALKYHKCNLSNPDLPDENKKLVAMGIEQTEIAIKEIDFYKNSMWNDLTNNDESFVFKYQEMKFQEICLNAIYTYETSKEIREYYYKHGRHKERLTQIFISFFRYNEKSILLMGYHKDDTATAKPFVNAFFSSSAKKINRKLSNLIIFNCETWVCSNNFYKAKLKELDSEFHKATLFSSRNGNQRRVFDVNIFKDDFKKSFRNFMKKVSLKN